MISKKYIWGNRTYNLYTPQKNKIKLMILGVLAIPFLLTPFTNGFYLLGLKLLFKLNPLWVYN